MGGPHRFATVSCLVSVVFERRHADGQRIPCTLRGEPATGRGSSASRCLEPARAGPAASRACRVRASRRSVGRVQRELVGRRKDLDHLVAWLGAPSSHAVAVELVGEPGIGKTALLDMALGELRGGSLARIAATAVEQRLTWTGLAQLVRAWPHGDVAALTRAQRRSLDAAIGLDDEPAEPGLVAGALASLLDHAAARGLVVLAVDDAHWLDEATAGVIAFAVRANRGRPVRLVSARRPVPSPLEPGRLVDPASFHSLVLSGLSTAAVHDLLSTSALQLTRPQLVHVHRATGGNPLHVIELARRVRDGEPVDDAVRQTSLESVIGQRVRSLPGAALTVLGAAALTATPTTAVLGRCFDDATLTDALIGAERAQLITVAGSTVRFVHPTVGAAAEAALGAVERSRLHRLLAEAVDDDERALHLDASTDGTDEGVADALDVAARSAWDRGAVEVGARRMTRAIERTPEASIDARWERRIALANMLLDLGAGRDAIDCIDVGSEASPPHDTELAARVVRIRATCRFHANDEATAARELSALVGTLPPGHPTRVDALVAQARMTVFLDVAQSVEVATMAAAEAPATGDQVLIDVTAACALSSRFLAGEPITMPSGATSDSRRLTASELLDELLLWSDDLERAEPAILDRIANAEQRGDLATVANISLQAADARMRRGDPRGALERSERALEVASVMDDRAWIANCHAWMSLANAYLSDVAAARRHLEAAARSTDDLSLTDQVAVRSSIGIAALLGDDPSTAVASFRRAREVTLQLRLHDCNALPFRVQMVEALLAVDHLDEAREVSAELMRFATAAGRRRGISDAHRATALVAAAEGDLDRARSCIEAAIAEHDGLPGPLEGAWSRLVAGVIERRARKRAVARAYFEQARDACRAAGIEALARRADVELARTGGRASTDTGALTPAEAQVARLVVSGHTNVEVAALLHMSTKTVEANLTRIYRKLGVRSRTELAARAPS